MAGRKSFLLRMDPELWADLEAWAQEELRSVNGQIEFVLKQAVRKRKGGLSSGPPPGPRENPQESQNNEPADNNSD
jgi:hypothetical protein